MYFTRFMLLLIMICKCALCNIEETNDYDEFLPATNNDDKIKVTFVENFLIKQDKLNKTVWIYEELPLNSTIAYFSSNTSHGLLIKSIVSNRQITLMDRFVLKASNTSNLYFLIVKTRLDRELDDFYDVHLVDSIGNSLNIRICLIDINDNRPILINNSTLNFSLLENHLYTNVFDLRAIDYDLGSNAKIEYKLMNNKHMFNLNRFNGCLDLIKAFDYETHKQVHLKIRLSDSSDSQKRLFNDYSITVNILDQNDNQPYFQQKTSNFSLRILKEKGTYIGSVKAFDIDSNSKTKYIIWPSKLTSFFHVEPYEGILKSSIKFDYPTELSFKIMAKDVSDYETSDQECTQCESIDINVTINDLSAQDPLVLIQSQSYLLDLSLINDENISLNLNESIVSHKFYDLNAFLNESLGYENNSIKNLNNGQSLVVAHLKCGLYMLTLESDLNMNILVVNSARTVHVGNMSKINFLLSKINLNKILLEIAQNESSLTQTSTIRTQSLLNSSLVLANNYMIIISISIFLMLALVLLGIIIFKYNYSSGIDKNTKDESKFVRKSSCILDAPTSSLSSSSTNVLINGPPPPTVGPSALDDLGYFGSSDYSDSNATHILKSSKNNSANTKIGVKYQQTATTSSSSSTTGDDATSGTSHTSTSNSTSPLFTITNQNEVQSKAINTQPHHNHHQVPHVTAKVFFERFERIYNSNFDMNTNGINNNRNSLATYSYV